MDREIRFKPGEECLCDAHSVKSVQEDGVGDGVRGHTLIKQDEDDNKPESAARRRSLGIFSKAVSVEQRGRKPGEKCS